MAESGVAETQAAVALAEQRRLLVFFPEGTFTREPGLLPFQLGAFVVAADARRPIVPAGLRGTRAVLRGDQWFPQKGRICLEIGPPIEPGATGFGGALELREAARAEVRARCGEPDLGPET